MLRVDGNPRKLLIQFRGMRINETSTAPFLFAGIQLSDDLDECNASPEFVKNVGTLEARIYSHDYCVDAKACLPCSRRVEDRSRKYKEGDDVACDRFGRR